MLNYHSSLNMSFFGILPADTCKLIYSFLNLIDIKRLDDSVLDVFTGSYVLESLDRFSRSFDIDFDKRYVYARDCMDNATLEWIIRRQITINPLFINDCSDRTLRLIRKIPYLCQIVVNRKALKIRKPSAIQSRENLVKVLILNKCENVRNSLVLSLINGASHLEVL